MVAIRQRFLSIILQLSEIEFGGYPYILGVKGNDGAILNIFG